MEVCERDHRMKILLLIFTLGLTSDGQRSMEVTGYSGGDIVITCKYEAEYTTNTKYFCEGLSPRCSGRIKTGAKNEWVTSGRFSAFDDTESAEFNVIIREVTVEDAGTYHCGVERKFMTDIYTKVDLNIKKSESPNILQQVHYLTKPTVSHKTTPSVPHFTLVPSQYAVTTSSVYLTTETQTAPDLVCIYVIVFGCVGLLLGGIILIIIIRYKRCKRQDPGTIAETSRDTNGEHGNGSIEVNLRLNQKNNASDSLYQSLNPNTNQSDSAYHILNPNTNQSDSHYQSLNPNTNQSDSVYHTLNCQTSP